MCDRRLCKQEQNGHSSEAHEALLARVTLKVNNIKSTNRCNSSVNKNDGTSMGGWLYSTATSERSADQPHFSSEVDRLELPCSETLT